MRKTLFIDVMLPLPVEGLFTYRVPFELNDVVEIGKRAVVQFGQKKIYTGLIHAITEIPPAFQAKYILSVLDIHPIVNPHQFNLWDWIASYYCCHRGEVMNAALPTAYKLASESKLMLNPDVQIDPDNLNEREYALIMALQQQDKLTLSQASRSAELIKVIPVVNSLVEKGYVLTEEEIGEKFRPRIETFVTLSKEYLEEGALQDLYSKLERKAPKQLELLIEYIQLSRCLSGDIAEVSRVQLLQRNKDGAPHLANLLSKGVFEQYEKRVSRLIPGMASSEAGDIELNSRQEEALRLIKSAFVEKQVTLLHGVTSSGKTEIYIKLIREVLDAGKQVLYLLPEIALTAHLISRLQKYFGPEVGVYHSRYDENERVEIWNEVNRHGWNHGMEEDGINQMGNAGDKVFMNKPAYNVILGARSALFLPFTNLGLVIVDEEHDSSFKQYDPAPRYNARDTAIYLASLHQAKVLLGSATPSIESYFNAKTGKFGLVTLSERYGGVMMPAIEVINLREETKKGKMKSIFSEPMLDGIGQALGKGEQVILFQNRRGFSLHIHCDNCNYIPQCIQCDVSLVYHKKANQLRCHYCGYTSRVPEKCPDCGYTGLLMKGFGTEKIEEELSIFFPSARITRMDLDSTRSKNALQRILSDFEERRIDILAGTQMVTKGLDFDNVSLVGIMNADNLLSYPDFRALERGFQLMAQVAGRSGRKSKQGKVLIQAFNPKHEIIRFVIENDYLGMYEQQQIERQKFSYPPYFRLIQLTLKHAQSETLNKAAEQMALILRKKFGKRVLGPEYPQVSRIRNLFLKNILIKVERGVDLAKVKENIYESIRLLHSNHLHSPVRVVIDVDPV